MPTSADACSGTNGYQDGYHAKIDDLASGSRPMILGGAEGTRTPDPHTASVVRYQLRHSPLLASETSPAASHKDYTGRATPAAVGSAPTTPPPSAPSHEYQASSPSPRVAD